jgi:uncharacterized glyoxalase superfamily protein PhnB
VSQQVTPYLLYEDGEAAIEFLTNAFGFREVDRAIGAAGGLHAELEVEPGGGRLYLGQPPTGFEGPAKVGQTTLVHVLVDDVDAHHDRAVAAGATVIQGLTDQDYGSREYAAVDGEDNVWSFGTYRPAT